MKIQSILALAVFTLVAYTNPQSADAATVHIIDDHTAVVMIDFAIDASFAEHQIPLAADHTVTYNDRVDVIGYTLTDQDDTAIALESASEIVLSTAPIMDNRYSVATSTEATFTLFAIIQTTEPLPEQISASITKLPYWVDGRRTTVHTNQLEEINQQ